MSPQKSSEQRSSDFANGVLLILIKIGSKAMPNNREFKAALQTIKQYLVPSQMSQIEESDLEEYKKIAKSILGERLDLQKVEEGMNKYGLNPNPSSKHRQR
jgi:heterodisulfide reductase subunit C